MPKPNHATPQHRGGTFPSRDAAHAFACRLAWDHHCRVIVVPRGDGWCVVDAGTPRPASGPHAADDVFGDPFDDPIVDEGP